MLAKRRWVDFGALCCLPRPACSRQGCQRARNKRTRAHVLTHTYPPTHLNIGQSEFEAIHKETAARKAEMERLATMEEARIKRIAADAESEIKAQHEKSKAEKQAEEKKRQAEADEVAKVSIYCASLIHPPSSSPLLP